MKGGFGDKRKLSQFDFIAECSLRHITPASNVAQLPFSEVLLRLSFQQAFPGAHLPALLAFSSDGGDILRFFKQMTGAGMRLPVLAPYPRLLSSSIAHFSIQETLASARRIPICLGES